MASLSRVSRAAVPPVGRNALLASFSVITLALLFFFPALSRAGGYVLSGVALSGYDRMEPPYNEAEHPMWPLADTHTYHFEGAYIQDVAVSNEPGGSWHANMYVEQTPSGGSVVSTYDYRADWTALPVVMVPGQRVSGSIKARMSVGGYYPTDSGIGVYAYLSANGIDEIYRCDLGPAGLGDLSKEVPVDFTVPEGCANCTIRFEIAATRSPTASWLRRYVYTYTWSEAAQPVPRTSGDPDSNPYTHFDEWKGAGVCSAMGLPTYWVNTSNLNLIVQDTDLSYDGLGPPIAMTRTYNSLSGHSGMFGNGWSFAYESRIETTGAAALVKKGSGQGMPYWAPLWRGWEGTPVMAAPPPGVFDSLTWYGGYWVLHDKISRLKYKYTPDPAAPQEYRLSSVTDPSGNSVRVVYRDDGTIQKVIDAAGRATLFWRDGSGRCTQMSAPDGRKATYSYDASGNLTETTDFMGNVSSYGYDTEKSMTTMTAAGKTTSFTYTGAGAGKVIGTVTDALNRLTSYGLSQSLPGQRTVTVIDPRGGSTVYLSLAEGQTSAVTDPLGKTQITAYAGGLPISVQDRNGRIVQLQYDDRGNLIRRTDPAGKSTRFVYNPSDNLVRKIDPLGGLWRYGYDSRGRLTSVTSPLGKISTMAYDPKGQLLSVTDAEGRKTIFTHDGFGNITSVSDALGSTTRTAYDLLGLHMASITDPRGFKTLLQYDANGRLTRERHPDGSSRTYGYNGCSQVSVTDENGHTTTLQRNALLFVTRLTDAMGNATRYFFDTNDNPTMTEGPLGARTRKGYDAAGRNVWLTDALGGTVRRGFDGVGNWTSVVDERGNRTRLAYDRNGRFAGTTDPLDGVTTMKRDGLGRIVEITNARGGKVSYSHDADGHLAQKAFDGTSQIAFTFDGSGKLVSATDGTGTYSITRDLAGRATRFQYPGGRSVAQTYDAAGNLKTVTYPGGPIVTYGYDRRNRIISIAFGGHKITRTWDAAGNLTGEIRSNGTSSIYGYDANDRLTGLKHLRGTAVMANVTYDYDAAGNLTGESGAFPLAPVLNASWASATYNGGNQIVARGPDIYSYDADGSLVEIAGTRSFEASYNQENRLTSITRSGVTSSFSYDPFGNRARVTTGAEVRNFHHDESRRLLFEADDTNAVTARYIYAGKQLVAMVVGASTYFFHFDRTGSTIALTDQTGAVKARYAYLPFRGRVNQMGTVKNPFTFIGAFGVTDEGGGLYGMRDRFYDGETGRFIQKDPLGPAAGANLYAYVGNSPVSRIDPYGLMGIDLGDWKFWVGTGLAGLGGVVVFSNPLTGGAMILIGGGIDLYSIYTNKDEIQQKKLSTLSPTILEYEQNDAIRWDPTKSRYEVIPRCDRLVEDYYNESEEEKMRAWVQMYNRLTQRPAREVLKSSNMFTK